jgi:hypothetical protein
MRKYLILLALSCTPNPPIYFKKGDIVIVPITQHSSFYGCSNKAKLTSLGGFDNDRYVYKFIGCEYMNDSSVEEINRLNGR